MRLFFSLLLGVFFISVTSFAQSSYYPFPIHNAQWSEEAGANNSSGFSYDGTLYTLGKDTVINNKNYTLVGYNEIWYSNAPAHVVNLQYSLPGAIIGAIRSDSSRRVWYRSLEYNYTGFDILDLFFMSDTAGFPLDSDVLIYDFNLKVGDSVRMKSQFANSVFNVSYVNSIDSIKINGEWRRRINFSLFDESWIEGIGSTFGLLGSHREPNTQEEVQHILLCYTLDSIQITSFLGLDVWGVNVNCASASTGNDISNIISSNISLYPNPVTDKLYINYPPSIMGFIIEIENILGNVVLSEMMNNTSVNISELPTGLYFLKLKNDAGEVIYYTKLVKE